MVKYTFLSFNIMQNGSNNESGSWSTFQITVGSPAQTFNVLISLSSLGTWLAIPDGCNSSQDQTVPANCSAVRGAQLGSTGWQSGLSTSYQGLADTDLSLNSDFNIDALGPNPDFNYPTFKLDDGAHYGLDTIQFTTDTTSSSTLTAASSPIYGLVDYIFFVDTLGLGYGSIQVQSSKPNPSLLQLLANASEISSNSVGYTAGASYSTSCYPHKLFDSFSQSKIISLTILQTKLLAILFLEAMMKTDSTTQYGISLWEEWEARFYKCPSQNS